ncbi:MAG TPA: thiamine pyrophosphate-binding protein [Thermoanaerobaculia bacterium]
MDGGELIARVLERHGVRHLFTLCGGHISPLLVGAKRRGLSVIDVRDEASAVFAADAMARLTGITGVAAVTAGPGVTNAVTAIKNAQLAQSPVVVLGGATATMLKGRGALQDVDQVSLLASAVKATFVAARVRELPDLVEDALLAAASGVPGPVFVELPVDLLYGEELVRGWYGGKGGGGLGGWLVSRYLDRHARRLFRGAARAARVVETAGPVPPPRPLAPDPAAVRRAAKRLGKARRPVLLVGAQALAGTGREDGPLPAAAVAAAVERLGVPAYLASGARGLLGPASPLQARHQRKKALREADLVLLAGVPADFRLDYGRQIGKKAAVVAANLSQEEMRKNRKPELAAWSHPGLFLVELARAAGRLDRARWAAWREALDARDAVRDDEIARMAAKPADTGINPLALCREIDRAMADDALIVADGGDFVATASYVLRPRGPLAWLDPGPFGTLGVGGGFALAAAATRPGREVWLLWGDGSAAFSLAEIDTCARHGLAPICVVGNDAGWTQIAREQVEVLGDAVGTELAPTDYHRVAEGYGGAGLYVDRAEDVPAVLAEAGRIAAAGRPVVVNARLGKTEFRKGSISM